MFSNNFVQIIANTAFYAFYATYNKDNTLERVLADNNLLRDVIMIGVSGALGQIFIYFAISIYLLCLRLQLKVSYQILN